MHIKFLQYLVDPKTLEKLSLSVKQQVGDLIISGTLSSKNNSYPIIDGVPRFVSHQQSNYARSFAYQWQRWPRLQFDSSNINGLMHNYTKKMWESICSVDSHLLKDQLVLDIGCGAGRFIEVVREKGASVIAIDYGSAIEVAANNFKYDHDVCLIQADALALPIDSSSIDGAYSIGVLHHTPAPEAGVLQAARVLKPSAWFGICVYPKGGYYDFISVQAWRRLFSFFWPIFRQYPPLFYSYMSVTISRLLQKIPFIGAFLSKAFRAFFPCVKLADFNWAVLDTFDSVTPSYQSAHTAEEVDSWLKKAEFYNVSQTSWGQTSFRAVNGLEQLRRVGSM